jgi:single-stranded DNA-binding protein
MAQGKLQDGSIMIAGMCARDAEIKFVGENQSRMCTVGVAVGKRPTNEPGGKSETVWCNLKAWHSLASILALARKGDSVFAIGRLEKREHNGKTYTDLVAEYLSVASINCAAASAATMMPPEDQFSEADDDGELPF